MSSSNNSTPPLLSYNFFVLFSDKTKQETIEKVIIGAGGTIALDVNENCIVVTDEENSDAVNSENLVDEQYITSCLDNGALLNIQNYKLKNKKRKRKEDSFQQRNKFILTDTPSKKLVMNEWKSPPLDMIILNPIEYHNWTKDEVCSLLCAGKKFGGANLHIEKVSLLYSIDFDGSYVDWIVTMLENKESNIEDELMKNPMLQNITAIYLPISTAVQLVETLFKTKLFHLWSSEQVKQQFRNFIKGDLTVGENELELLSKLSLSNIVETIRKLGVKETMKELQNEHINSSSLEYFLNWIESISVLKIPRIKAQQFIGPVSQFEGSISYQNNKSNVFQVGETILKNLHLKLKKENERFQRLLVNFAYYGFGKTRFGIEFLDLWKYLVENNREYFNELQDIYGESLINILMSTELIYVDLSASAHTLHALKNIIPRNNTYYFVVLDEFPAFCSEVSKSEESILLKMYRVWNECVNSIQKLPNVVSVYVCGKGAFIDLIGKSVFQNNYAYRSPTECFRVELHCFTEENVQILLDTETTIRDMLNEDEYQSFVEEMMEETAGVPLLVNKIIISLKGKSKENYLSVFDSMEQLPGRIIYPCSAEKDSFALQIYTFLMFISLMPPELKSDMEFSTDEFELGKIPGLENVKKVDLSTLAVALNCYITHNDGNAKLIFPKRTIKKQVEISTSFSIAPFVKAIPHLMRKGNTFETLIGDFIIWKSLIGAHQKTLFPNVFTFFGSIPLVQNHSCIGLKGEYVPKRLTSKNASKFWSTVHGNISKYKNKVNFMLSESFGPEKFIILQKDLWWCIQDKNTEKFDFTTLDTEIHNLKVFPSTITILFTVFYRAKVELEKVYTGGSVIKRPTVETGRKPTITEIKVPTNVIVVIVDQREVKKFIGQSNFDALVQLA